MITKKTGRVSAVVMGLIAGILLFIFALIFAAVALFFQANMLRYFGSYLYGAEVIASVIIFVIGLLNIIGGCIVRSSRIAGGVLMIITAIPIIFVSLGTAWASAVMVFIALLGLLSLAASILAFVPYTDRYIQLCAQRKQQHYQQPYPYQQPPQPQYRQQYTQQERYQQGYSHQQQYQPKQQQYQQPQYRQQYTQQESYQQGYSHQQQYQPKQQQYQQPQYGQQQYQQQSVYQYQTHPKQPIQPQQPIQSQKAASEDTPDK